MNLVINLLCRLLQNKSALLKEKNRQNTGKVIIWSSKYHVTVLNVILTLCYYFYGFNLKLLHVCLRILFFFHVCNDPAYRLVFTLSCVLGSYDNGITYTVYVGR